MLEDYQKAINQIDPYVLRFKMVVRITLLTNMLRVGVKLRVSMLVLAI